MKHVLTNAAYMSAILVGLYLKQVLCLVTGPDKGKQD